MSLAGYAALVFTVILLVATAYFLMGGLPLLILQHDTALDGKFIGRFFDIYYKTAVFAAAGACVAYLLWGRIAFSVGMSAIAISSVVLRRRILPVMERLALQIQHKEVGALATFRKIHSVSLLVNFLLLAGLVWGVTQLKL